MQSEITNNSVVDGRDENCSRAECVHACAALGTRNTEDFHVTSTFGFGRRDARLPSPNRERPTPNNANALRHVRRQGPRAGDDHVTGLWCGTGSCQVLAGPQEEQEVISVRA